MEEKSKQLLIKKIICIGKGLQERTPFISELYRGGLTFREISHHLEDYYFNEISSLFGEHFSSKILSNSVGYALRGSNNRYKGAPSYGGLLSAEEFRKISSQNRLRGLQTANNSKRNLRALVLIDCREAARASARTRGLSPWEEPEINFLQKYLSGRNGDGPGWVRASELLNAQFYDGNSVRNSEGVRFAARRYNLI